MEDSHSHKKLEEADIEFITDVVMGRRFATGFCKKCGADLEFMQIYTKDYEGEWSNIVDHEEAGFYIDMLLQKTFPFLKKKQIETKGKEFSIASAVSEWSQGSLVVFPSSEVKTEEKKVTMKMLKIQREVSQWFDVVNKEDEKQSDKKKSSTFSIRIPKRRESVMDFFQLKK